MYSCANKFFLEFLIWLHSLNFPVIRRRKKTLTQLRWFTIEAVLDELAEEISKETTVEREKHL